MMTTKNGISAFLFTSLLFCHGSETALAGPFDKSSVGASGVGIVDRAANGITMGIIFDTMIPAPSISVPGSRSHNQVEALRTLFRDYLKTGDYLFVQSATRAYNGRFIGAAGGGEGIWSGGLMLPLLRIGTAEEASPTVWTKERLLQWVDRLEQREDPHTTPSDTICEDPDHDTCSLQDQDNESGNPGLLDWNESSSGRPNMQGAIYMARHMFKSASSLQTSGEYRSVLFIFSAGRFIGSVNPAVRNPHVLGGPEIETPPIGDWYMPPSYKNSRGVLYKADRMSPCTDAQAHNSYGPSPNGYYDYQCFDYWNNTHRTDPAPLPTAIATSAAFESHIPLRVNRDGTWPYGTRSLYFDSICGSQGAANALAAEQADLARSQEGVSAIIGFIPKYNHSDRVDKQHLAAMQRLTWDKGLPGCWVMGRMQGATPCGTGPELVAWRFHKTYRANGSEDDNYDKIINSSPPEKSSPVRCGGYGEYRAADNSYDAGDVIAPSARRQMIWTSTDFEGLDEVLKRNTNDVRGLRLMRPTTTPVTTPTPGGDS